MSNTIKFLLFILSTLILLNLYIFYKNMQPSNAEILASNICNSKSITYLYTLKRNKQDSLKAMFKQDIIQLVHDYDEQGFSETKVLSNICNDWDKVIKKVIYEYLKKEKETHSDFKLQLEMQIKKIEDKCN